MADLKNKYLDSLLNIKNPQQLIDYSIQFIQTELNIDAFAVMFHRIYPQPYEVIFSAKMELDLETIQEEVLKSFDLKSITNKIKGKIHNYFFFDSLLSTGSGLFYLSTHSINDKLESILHLWDQQQVIIRNVTHYCENQMNDKLAGLTSQLMHDMQAIINLTANVEKSDTLIQRIEYQKKVNKNLLFWIRDCELMKATVTIQDLLESSLQIAGIESSIIDLTMPPNPIDISVDVELFSIAFNEIVQNAIEAVDKNLSKIRIGVSQIPSVSPFLGKNWTIIQVEDSGPGIKEDFIDLVMNPFFTTKKESGFSGFGLANAKKIIEAHQGCIELMSKPGKGTTFKIMIPG